ncbi:MAG: SH3 domain-containing protein, partial [Sulfurimonadaceae bacterium]|nr:SH3 domain-containing protein [Sulfurimonadaceae bacterium]
MKYIILMFISLFFLACSGIKPDTKKESQEIVDLVSLPQDIEFYMQNLQEDQKLPNEEREERYIKYYFNVWNNSKPRENKESVLWPFNAYTAQNSFGENLKPLSSQFFVKMRENSNFDTYGVVSKKGITLTYTSLRLFPTNRPLFKDPAKAGEGFPFDYLQNSSVAPNKPLFISHYSKDKEWAYVFSSFASGWIPTKEMVILEEEQVQTIQKAELLFFTKEDFTIADVDGNFLFRSRVGMNLPLIGEEEDYFIALAIHSYKNTAPQFLEVKIPKTVAQKSVLSFTKENIINIV